MECFTEESYLALSTVKRLIKKLRETKSNSNLKQFGQSSANCSKENIAKVGESAAESQTISVRISTDSLQRILTKYLHLRVYKVQLTQELKRTYHGKRKVFVEWIMKQH